MKLTFRCAWLAAALATGWGVTPVAGAPALEDAAAVRARFVQPPREFASAPLWVWNDRLTEEQIRSTLRDLAGQHVRQARVPPRPGLMPPYLSAGGVPPRAPTTKPSLSSTFTPM